VPFCIVAKSHKEKGNRGEREWRDFLISHGFKAIRNRDDLVDVRSNIEDVHWEVKREETPRPIKAMEQATKDAAGYGKVPIVAFRTNRQPWHCILPAEFLMELLKLREEWVMLKAEEAGREAIRENEEALRRLGL
jgi:Holliday junction resolvase